MLKRAGEQLEEVKVTGSRILRRDLDASSPLVTVGSDTFEASGTVAIETSLNKLPQFVPSVTQFTTGDIQNTAINTVGASTVNLRGLGENRTLVLLDGRRAMPVNASLVVDINTIPSAAIKRVEIISGGASSTYGADAVGGVVNFILKNDFEGMEFDTQYGITEMGDDQELRISGLMGGNFSDNRGNAMFGVEYFKRGAARQDERDFYTKGWADPTVAGTEAFWSGSGYAPTFANQPTSRPRSTASSRRRRRTASSRPARSISTRTAASIRPPMRTAPTATTAFWTTASARSVPTTSWSRTRSRPSPRFRRIATRCSVVRTTTCATTCRSSCRVSFTKTNVRTVSQFDPAVSGWSVQVQRDADHPVPTELARLLDSRTVKFDPISGAAIPGTGANADWQLDKELTYLGNRGSSDSNQTYQLLAGLSGTLPIKDWTWEGYVSHGNTENQERPDGLRLAGALSRADPQPELRQGRNPHG